MKTFLLTLLISAVAMGADVTGNWSGSFEYKSPEGEAKSEPCYMVFKQEGAKLSGSGGPSADRQWPMQNGKVDGDRLTFEISNEGRNMSFELTTSGDQVEGEGKMSREGQTRIAKFTLKRVK
ncbi:MAG: hypothetical protein HYR60_32420 [Acidobacteria bacterium]|nr:hypothetical protein [Acidobacteriota bacterium]MBI3473343.1 hypothetical protein [Candidatus Solibacter usitatus]